MSLCIEAFVRVPWGKKKRETATSQSFFQTTFHTVTAVQFTEMRPCLPKVFSESYHKHLEFTQYFKTENEKANWFSFSARTNIQSSDQQMLKQ